VVHDAFRTAKQHDLEAIYQLNVAVFSEAWSRESFEDAWASAYDIVLCEDENKQLIAYYLGLSVLHEKQTMQLAVAKKAQNKGVGFALMRFMMLNNPNFMFSLEVRESNQAAISLYRKLGFQVLACRKNYYRTQVVGVRENALLMQYP